MEKYIKYIFAKSCIIEIYFAYTFFIKVRYICQNIFDIYFNAFEIYFGAKKLYMSHVYSIFMGVNTRFLYSTVHSSEDTRK